MLGVTCSEVSGRAHLHVEGQLWEMGVLGPHVRVGWLWGQQGSAGLTLQGSEGRGA